MINVNQDLLMERLIAFEKIYPALTDEEIGYIQSRNALDFVRAIRSRFHMPLTTASLFWHKLTEGIYTEKVTP